MNGHLLSELPIAVDYFASGTPAQLYFLTHAHSDHTVGLTKTWRKKIYCTDLTGKAIIYRLEVDESCVVPLEELQPHVFKLKTNKDWVDLTVTVIPAYHCPGSCMFLFETKKVRVLYTGDFRPTDELYEVGKTLWGTLHREIDVLYLDNTYSEPMCVFPSRANSIQQIVDLCKLHDDCNIYTGVNFTGHEDLLETIALELQRYIIVTPKHLELLQILGRKDVFTTDKDASNIHALPSRQVTLQHLEKLNETEYCIGILPSAKFCHLSRVIKKNSLIQAVPYSNHSSFKELWKFIENVSPCTIKPIVSGCTDKPGMESYFRADMSRFDCLLREKSLETFSPQKFTRSQLDNSPTFNSALKRKRCARRPPRKKLKPCGVVFQDND